MEGGGHHHLKHQSKCSQEENAERSVEEARELEDLLNSTGYGLFHVILVLLTGIASAADAVEVFGVSFVLPIADRDLDLTTAHKGYLDASIFVGQQL